MNDDLPLETAPAAPTPKRARGLLGVIGANKWLVIPLCATVWASCQFSIQFYLDHTYVKKEDETKHVQEVRTLVYDRTRPIMDRVAGMETTISGMNTKLDERDKRETERSANTTASLDELKRGQHDIELYLRQPRR